MTDDKRKRDSEQPVEHRGYWERLWEATHPREAEAARERQRRIEYVLRNWQP